MFPVWLAVQLGYNLSASAVLTSPPYADVLTGVSSISAGNYHTCVLTVSTGVRCWGSNSNYQVHYVSVNFVGSVFEGFFEL